MYIYFCYLYIIKFEQMSSKEDIEKIQSAEKKAIEEDKDPIVSEKNEKLGQLRDFKPLLSEKLRLLQQFTKFLIQKQSQLILLPLQVFNLNYDKNLDLIIGEDDQYLKIKFKKLYEDFLKSRKMLIDYGEKRRDVKIKQQKILKEILKEKQKCQIYHFCKKQVKQIDQHVDSITNLMVPIKQFSEQQFQLTIKIAARLLDNYQTTKKPSIQKNREEDQILKSNNEAIQETNKRLLPIEIEQHSGVDNFNQIKQLKQSIKVKRQKFNHNYNEESQKITIEQLVEQFDKIEKELTQNEQEIENIISNIKKVKDSMVSEKNVGLRDFKPSLLSEKLRLLEQFRKFLIQKQSQFILLPKQAFNLKYDKNLDLLIYNGNQSFKINFQKLLDYYEKISKSLRSNKKIQDVLMKKQQILNEILKEKQGCQIYHFRLKQFIQMGKYYNCICKFGEKIFELLQQIVKSLDQYQITQELENYQIFELYNQAILLPIEIEQHSHADNFNQIKQLKQSIKVKRQKFNHNYNEESQKITIEQLVEQFDKIEKELTQNEQEIENIISNIKKVKESIVSEKNEKLVPPSKSFHKDSENDHFE